MHAFDYLSDSQDSSEDQPHKNDFLFKHIGPRLKDIQFMLSELGYQNITDFIQNTVPSNIFAKKELTLSPSLSEKDLLEELQKIASLNEIYKSYLGMGYHDCFMPPVIKRLIFQNPNWYTAYTPYQAEISQGRLEMLLNFQQMIMDLTGFSIANASLLDEATACAEAMTFMHRLNASKGHKFAVDPYLHPQNLAVLQTRAQPLDIEIIQIPLTKVFQEEDVFGILLQYPNTLGEVIDYQPLIRDAHQNDIFVGMAADLLSLTILTPPAELGADVAIGSTQRFGLPLGFGGPHAAYFATKDAYKRNIPGRIIGVSHDRHNQKALRMALQTREQHIRREKATSNICTAQALPAILATAYAIYLGPETLRDQALKIHRNATILANGLKNLGYKLFTNYFFDTIAIHIPEKATSIIDRAYEHQINLRLYDLNIIIIALDETTSEKDVFILLSLFAEKEFALHNFQELLEINDQYYPQELSRKTPFLTHRVFNSYHSETEFMRYLKNLEDKDLSLTRTMIPLGSCTMKLNSATELTPITWSCFNEIHPYAPLSQTKGYSLLCRELENDLAEITGFDAVSLQPNAGSQGEFAGLLAIKAYHERQGQFNRTICLIPSSAHGTNPATAKMAGLEVIVVPCDPSGNVDILALKHLAHEYRDRLAAFMITYPSTHGVFESQIKKMTDIIHENGGQVYFDGANLNALIGIGSFAELGGDVCHINLHKTFCIPHGGGGPGVGPIAVKAHLKPFLPQKTLNEKKSNMISAAPYGSASILPISFSYIRLMGKEGLLLATQIALLNANYIAHKLSSYYEILYKGMNGRIAHECILDLRSIRDKVGITVDDFAKRLIDYGFHAPTISFPISGTMMIEPTESESLEELDRFIEAMILIRKEIDLIEKGVFDKENNPLKNAPHIVNDLMTEKWDHPYTKEVAFFPTEHTKKHKYWSPVSRINNDYGDRNLFCGCE